jgi:type II secretory ATPase GspE/PulE/Tfp pilus assembly ATPase PilB-like protein
VGPTGHGKSITLKAFYEAMNPTWRIIVIEDPVEYIINHRYVTQENVVPDKGLTIKKYIKSSLRQFPKVIGISEIRDIEVAEEVINISLSGHKMVATMHANDALAVLPRLDTIGVSFKKQAQSGLFSSTMSQRLLPKLCSKCKVKTSTEEYGDIFTKKPGGCISCEFKGIDGRVLVGEIIIFDSHIRDLLKNDRFNEILPYLKTMGWRSMLDVGISKVKAGLVDPKDLFQSLGDPKNTLGSHFDYRMNSFVVPKVDTTS